MPDEFKVGDLVVHRGDVQNPRLAAVLGVGEVKAVYQTRLMVLWEHQKQVRGHEARKLQFAAEVFHA